MSTKFDFEDIINETHKSLKKSSLKDSVRLGSDLPEVSQDPKDYVVMPEWFKKYYGVPGLQLGTIIEVAGDSDTGKTSFAIEVIKAAQDQGHPVIYMETEGKTTVDDLENKGIDTDNMALVQNGILDQAWHLMFLVWDSMLKKYPDVTPLIVIDSLGQTVTSRDREMDILKDSQKPGESAKINNMAINKLVSKMMVNPASVLVINSEYDKIGPMAKGKVQKGGKTLYFQSKIIIQTARIGFTTKTVKGVKVQDGAKVRFRTFKNHYAKSLRDADGNKINLPKDLNLIIDDNGLTPDESK